MATAWMTYAWDDNDDGDVDYVAQQLTEAGLTIKLDRWNVDAGKPLWDQIDRNITDPSESDSWVFYATATSLVSEPCLEEYRYALGRALKERGEFPVIGLFPGPVDDSLIPAGISSRLYVTLTDPDWVERVVAATEGREHSIPKPHIQPYSLRHHVFRKGTGEIRQVFEIRPRVGMWVPVLAAVPSAEEPNLKPSALIGPRGVANGTGMVTTKRGHTMDDKWSFIECQEAATPTHSYFLYCDGTPSAIMFGPTGGPFYTVNIRMEKRS